jgi:glutamate formiminotransferase
VPMATCAELARRLGRRLGDELALPVVLYAEAATRPERRRLPDIRRPRYEGLRELVGRDPSYAPDFGPSVVGPAGATAVGARPFLIAFNVNLASGDLAIAKAVAQAVRESSGGLPAVQALGMRTHDPTVVQVSMNLLDADRTPLHILFEAVRQEAARHGVAVVESELVGLIPTATLAATTRAALSVRDLTVGQAVEARALEALLSEEVGDFPEVGPGESFGEG